MADANATAWLAGYLRFRPLFAAALDPRLYTLDHLDALVESGRGVFFHTGTAAIVAELRAYPTGARVVHGLVAAGDLADIVEILIPAAEAWGRSRGCIAATIESRPGWARLLKTHGYAAHQTAVWKDL